MGGQSALSGEVCIPGVSNRDKLHHLLHDTLTTSQRSTVTAGEMFEFLFKYPATVFSQGQFVLLAAWPAWTLGLAILAIALGLGWHVQRRRGFLTGARPVAIWLLETLLASLVLFLLWHPAISIATLRP